MHKIEFYKHNLSSHDKKNVREILDSLFLTTGDVVKEFENRFARYLGTKHAVGVSSCTQALFLALKYFGIGPGDEVITIPLSFIATANAIEHCGARPIFVDVEESTGNINAELIEKVITPRTKAILPVHLYGQMCDMKKIKNIAQKHNLKIIEDAAHSIESRRDEARPGWLSNMACFSFYATKNITCGEGGAIACNNKKIYDWLLKARLHGMSRGAAERYTKKYKHYDMEFLGHKANMTNIDAALLLHQLQTIEKFLAEKEKIAQKYGAGFKNNKFIKIPAVLEKSKHARHLYTIWVNPLKRDDYLSRLQKEHIGVAINFRPIHLMKYYRQKYGYKPGDFPLAERIGASTISLPLYPRLTSAEINRVIRTVNNIVTR